MDECELRWSPSARTAPLHHVGRMLTKLNRLWLSSMKKAASVQRMQGKLLLSAAKKLAESNQGYSSASVEHGVASIGSWTSGYHHAYSAGQAIYYRLFIPKDVVSAIPLVVMLHGCQQNAAEFSQGTRMNDYAASKGFAVLYPEQSLRAHPHRCWRWYENPAQEGKEEVAALVSLIQEVSSKHGIDSHRIYACGMSAGAAMAHLLALTQPALLAAVGLHSGPVFGACKSAATGYRLMQHGSRRAVEAIEDVLTSLPAGYRMPAILISGAVDQIVRPINHIQLTEQFLKINRSLNLNAKAIKEVAFGRASKKRPTQRKMAICDYSTGRQVIIRSVMIQDLGHAWSGGDKSLRFNDDGPNASRLIIEFLAKHRSR